MLEESMLRNTTLLGRGSEGTYDEKLLGGYYVLVLALPGEIEYLGALPVAALI